MNITKNKLPKGFTYPLSSGLLEESLVTEEFTAPVTLRYSADSQLLMARFYLRRPWECFERFVLSSGAVNSRDSVRAKEHLAKSVVPEFTAWAHEIVNLPANSSRFTGQQFLQWKCPINEFNRISTVSMEHLVADKLER